MSQSEISFSEKLAARSRKAIRFSSENLIKTEFLFEDKAIPLLVRPSVEGVNLLEWSKANHDFIQSQLLKHGAILFRSFGVSSIEAFQAFAEATSSGGLLDYTFRSTPRRKVSGGIYTSTEYPQDQSIPMHNEMSYTRSWPMKIWFYCVKASPQGGATPIAHSAKVFQRVNPEIREKFLRHGVMYVRNYREGLDLSYQEVFGTSNRAEIERFCQEADIECEFDARGRLQTRQKCQAIAVHPRTGETVWFNQAHLFHISSLDPAYSASLLATYGQDGLPRNSYYGDGATIAESELNEIREAFRREAVSFPWAEGDVLMLDNMLVAHGREPFSGPRKIVVAMAEQHPSKTSNSQIAS